MQVYLLRHAIAVEREEWTQSDAERPLTGRGQKRLKQALAGLQRLGPQFDHIVTSPYRRALQTAEIAATTYQFSAPLQVTPTLEPEADCREIAQLVTTLAATQILLVGHSPSLDDLMSYWLGGATGIYLKKAGCAALEIFPDAAHNRLQWLLTPQQLRLLAR